MPGGGNEGLFQCLCLGTESPLQFGKMIPGQAPQKPLSILLSWNTNILTAPDIYLFLKIFIFGNSMGQTAYILPGEPPLGRICI